MHVIDRKALRKAAKKHPRAKAALTYIENLFNKAKWRSLNDVRKDRKDCDQVAVASERILQIFNVCKNDYRLLVHIHFNRQKIYIREFMTHQEYTLGNWKNRH